MSNLEEQITVYAVNRAELTVDGLASVPAIGAGLYHEGTFWRVVDVWFNADNTTGGPLPYGWIVKVDLSPTGDEPPYEFDAKYYAV
jgi:hypothetical protein